MEQIYAPWRIDWVERDDDPIEGCPFCVLPDRDDEASPTTDRDARIVARSAHNYVLLNNSPYNPGHAMVIPDEHHEDWTDLPDEVMLDHGRLKGATLDAMRAGPDPDAFNTGLNLGGSAAGGSIDHLHTHVVPRWDGDTNFMPVVSDTKVIVEAVDRTYEHLHDAFADLDAAVEGPDAGTADADEGSAIRLTFD